MNNEFKLNLNDLMKYDLTIVEYLFLMLVYKKNFPFYFKYEAAFNRFDKKMIQHLVKNEWIIKVGEGYDFQNYEVTNRFISTIKSNVADWIDEWRDIFPKGVKSGGHFIRSDRVGCIKKMVKFINNYPEYNKKLIIQATNNYVIGKERDNYTYMKLAQYFIEKDGVSILASECEAIVNNEREDVGDDMIDDI